MLFALVLLSILFSADDDLSLGGVVFDLNATTVSEARVVLENPVARRKWETITKDDGTFRFDRLPFGTYRITVHKEGYFETGTEIRLEASKTIEFTLAMSETLKQEIEVVARPDPINVDAVAAQHTVNDEVIQNLPFNGRRNFLNALTLMPGVLRDNSSQIHIHGSRSDQVRYQLDGMNLTDASTGNLGSNIPIDAIESVDLDLAGYSAEFGKGSGGVVRVHSQFIGNEYKFNLTDFIPGFNLQRKTLAELSPRLLISGPLVKEKLWFMYSGSLRYVRTFLDDLPDPNNRQNETASDHLTKLQWNLGESHVFTLNLIQNFEFFGNYGLSTARPVETTTNFLRRGTTLAASDRHVRGRTLLESIFQWTRRRDSDLAKGATLLEVRPEIWRGNFPYDRHGRNQRFHAAQTIAREFPSRGMTHRFKAGAEFDHVESNLEIDRRPFRFLNEMGNLRSSVTFLGPNSALVNNQEYGLFMLDRIVVRPALQFELGLRFDRERVVGRNNVAPRAAFSFLPFGTERSKISGGVGLFYDNIALLNLQLPRMQRRFTTLYDNGQPSPTQTATEVRINPGLRNPSGLHFNIGWEHEWAPRWVSRIDYVQKDGRDQVRLAALPNANGFDLMFNNSGHSTYRGIEFALDRPIRTNLRILGSYIYSNAKARPSVSLDFPDPAVELVPEARTEWDVRHRFISWGYFPLIATMNGSYAIEARSGFPYSTFDDLNRIVGAFNSRHMPVFFSTNVSVEKEIRIPFRNKRVALRVGVTNLFNRFNPRFVDANVNSPYFGQFAQSTGRHFVGRVRILKK